MVSYNMRGFGIRLGMCLFVVEEDDVEGGERYL